MRSSTLAFLVLPPLFWGSNVIVGRMAAGLIPPITLNFLRWALAFVVFLPFVFVHIRKDWVLVKKHWLLFATTGFLSITCYNALQYLALISSSPINVALMAASSPIMTLLIGRLLYQSPISRTAAIGAVVSLTGVVWVLIRGDLNNLSTISFVVGDLYMLLAILFWSFYTWLLKGSPKSMSGNSILSAQIVWGMLFAIPMVLAEISWGGYPPVEWNVSAIGIVTYVALIPALLGYLCWQKAVARTGSLLPMFFVNLTPVFAAIMSVVLLREFPHAYHLIGLVLIVMGIWLAYRPQKP